MNKLKLGGSYIERELYQSKAFMSLKAFSVKLLILFFDKRMRESRTQAKDKKGIKRVPKFINLDNIAMPYAEIEKKYGIKRQTITRAIDDLLAKGFIEIRHHGGCCQHDKTIWSIIGCFGHHPQLLSVFDNVIFGEGIRAKRLEL